MLVWPVDSPECLSVPWDVLVLSLSSSSPFAVQMLLAPAEGALVGGSVPDTLVPVSPISRHLIAPADQNIGPEFTAPQGTVSCHSQEETPELSGRDVTVVFHITPVPLARLPCTRHR